MIRASMFDEVEASLQVWLMILPVLTVSSLPYQVYVQTDVRSTSLLAVIETLSSSSINSSKWPRNNSTPWTRPMA